MYIVKFNLKLEGLKIIKTNVKTVASVPMFVMCKVFPKLLMSQCEGPLVFCFTYYKRYIFSTFIVVQTLNLHTVTNSSL